nr:hypothetical protein [Tanacetum cinerariifolium]
MVPSIKLPILNKGEYILWTMKMEQYLAHTDYALWEVILNGNSVVQMTKDEVGNEVEVPLVTTRQILARTRERKAKRTLLMAIPDVRLARFHEIKDAKTLWAAIKTRFGGNDESKKISPQLDNEDLRKIDQDDLEEMDLKWQVVMLSMRMKRFYKKTRRKLEFNRKETIGFDKTKVKVKCFNCHRRWHFARDYKIARNLGNRIRDTGNAGYRGRDNEEEATDFALMAFISNPLRSSSLNFKLYEALREKEDSKAKLKKFETSLKNLTKLLDSQISVKVKTGLGYDSQFNKKEVLYVKGEEVTETVFDNRSSDKENSLANDRFKKGEGYYAVPLPLTGNYMPPKFELSFTGLDDSIYNDNDSVFRPSHICAKIDFVKADKMAKKYVLPNNVRKGTSHKESRLVWNNVQRINHQNKFAPTAVFIRSGRILVSVARPKAAASTSATKPVNIAGPKQSVNFSKSRSTFPKSHLPIRRSFYNATTHSRRNSTKRVNTDGSKAVSAVKGNEVTAVKTSAGCVWRPRVNEIDQISKDNRWICSRVNYGHPQQALKNKGINDCGCSRHMTGKKAYLADYQKIIDGGFVSFGSSR